MKRLALAEAVAALEHEQWQQWASGVLVYLPPVKAEAWRRAMRPYEELRPEMREPARYWAHRILGLIEAHGVLRLEDAA